MADAVLPGVFATVEGVCGAGILGVGWRVGEAKKWRERFVEGCDGGFESCGDGEGCWLGWY